jgi:polyisoprenoid-binding protein YceI
MASIANTDLDEKGQGRIAGHLKGDDFFGVEEFPEASFKVNNSEMTDGKTLRVSGDLTIKGHTNPISFLSTLEKGESSLIFTGIMEVDRSLFDVRYGSDKFFDNLGDKAISDIFTLEFRLFLEQ